jgi:hypothetical protein
MGVCGEWVENVSGRPMRTDDELPRRDGEVAAEGCDDHGILFRSLISVGLAEGFHADADMADLALHAGLVLGFRHASLADVYVGSAALLPPSLIRLANWTDRSTYRTLRARVVAEHARPVGLTGLLRNELAFQRAVVDALGGQTLIALMGMLHRIIENTMSRMDWGPSPVGRHLAEAKSHDEIVRLVEAGRGQAAATLACVRTKQVAGVIREYDAAAYLHSNGVSGQRGLRLIPPADGC